MANPRKFSEKIALHHQKQAEETAAFEQIMREVSDVTNKGSTPRHNRLSVDDEVKSDELPICISISSFRSGSLPNVAAPLGQTTHDAEVKPEEMTLSTQWTQLSSPEMGSVGRPIHRSRSTTHASQSVGPMRPSRKLDTSPYGSNIYLSPPPPDGGMWRRTHSDSALHQSSSLGSPGSVSPHTHTAHLPGHHSYHPIPHTSPHSQQHTHSQHSLHTAHLHQQHQYMPMAGQQHSPHRRVTDSNLESMLAMAVHGNQHPNPERPRSSCDTPRVPGISVYPSHDLNSQNTAYSSHGKHSHPHQHPQQHPQLQVPTCAGTGSLPDLTSVRSYEHHAAADAADDHSSNSPCYSSSPVSASPATLSPTQLPLQPSHHSQHSPYTNDHNADHTQHNQNHLSVPNNRYLHQNKGQGQAQQEQSWIQAGYQQQCSPPSVHSSHSNINIPSPTMGMGVMSGSPHQHSAGGSPGGAGGGGESPQNSSAVDNYYINQALQQHFEQFSMTDAPVSNLNYINSTTNSPHYTQSNARTPERDQHGISSGNNGDTTMCGIPDIILTDFSNTSSGVADLSKELGVSSHLDTSLFPDDEGLREGLDPIDFDGLQMLTDPDLAVSDPTTEDAFRLDRL